MKNIFLMLLTAGLLASCAPKTESTTTTSTDGATTTTTTTETTTTGSDSTLANNDQANVSEEVDMAAGAGLEGIVMNTNASDKTFGLNENDKNYKVTVTDATVFEGNVTSADDFFGADRTQAKVAVEGKINGDQIEATKVTTNP